MWKQVEASRQAEAELKGCSARLGLVWLVANASEPSRAKVARARSLMRAIYLWRAGRQVICGFDDDDEYDNDNERARRACKFCSGGGSSSNHSTFISEKNDFHFCVSLSFLCFCFDSNSIPLAENSAVAQMRNGTVRRTLLFRLCCWKQSKAKQGQRRRRRQ